MNKLKSIWYWIPWFSLCGCSAHKPIAKYPSEGIHQCGAEVVQADGSTWVTPCWPESHWKKPYCVKGCDCNEGRAKVREWNARTKLIIGGLILIITSILVWLRILSEAARRCHQEREQIDEGTRRWSSLSHETQTKRLGSGSESSGTRYRDEAAD